MVSMLLLNISAPAKRSEVTHGTKGNVTLRIYEMLDSCLNWSLRGLYKNMSIPVRCVDSYSNYLTMLASKQPVTRTDVEIFERPVSNNEPFPEFVKSDDEIWLKRLRRYWSKDYYILMRGKLNECMNVFELAYNNVYSSGFSSQDGYKNLSLYHV